MPEMSEVLYRMTEAIAYRGPDDEGFLQTQTRDNRHFVGLAHRRLSIIDLSRGHQPIGNEDGSVQIVFNGEVYNFQELRAELEACGHIFVTQSDTETIVHAYEEWEFDCVKRFRGMFAFAIWDSKNERLFIARDRFGKKPLFLYEKDGLLIFASEIKSILAFPGIEKRVNMEAIWEYFAYRYVPAPATFFAGVRKLMPGSYAFWQKGKLIEYRYYVPPDHDARHPGTEPADPVGSFLEQLEEAVRIRMVSDVPFGAFLSGGIDSSAVVGLMSRHSNLPVKTYSVGFSESKYSELCYAKTIANLFRTEHHELTISYEHLIEHLPDIVYFRDAPVAEPSDIPIYLLSKEARRTVKMVLTGEGSDEILGGYPKHVYERYVPYYQLLPDFIHKGLIEPLTRALPYRFRRVKTAISNFGLIDREERMTRWFGALSYFERQALLEMSEPAKRNEKEIQFDTAKNNSLLRNILYFDQTSWLPDNLLERGDRMTMAASLEARMPFMDHKLAAYVSGLSDKWRVNGHTTKYILREAMKRILPKKILERPKIGFRVPVNEWFRGSMREYLLDHLTGPDSRTIAYYRKEVLQRYLKEHIQGTQNHEKLLWSLLNLELWHRQYGMTA